MEYEQVRGFRINDMGNRPGYCLSNVEDGFGITKYERKFATAKDDMLYQKAHGTLHPFSTLPPNVSVPVYLDTSSPYEHVIVSDCQRFYSDGKAVNRPTSGIFGWGECCGGVRVVKLVKKSLERGDKVTLIDWVDYKGTRLKQTRSFYFVDSINGDRVVLRADGLHGVIYAAVKKDNLKLI